MLQIPRKVEYALRAVVYLANQDTERRASFKEIGESQDVPQDFLAKIMRSLVCAGVVDSSRGSNGGYRLARPANQITFLEVVEAADGPIALNDCCEHGVGCSKAALCSMEQIWRQGESAMKQVFANVRISELACEDVLKTSAFMARAEQIGGSAPAPPR